MMLYIKYQSSMPRGFGQKDVFIFPYISLRKTCDYQGGPIFAPWA